MYAASLCQTTVRALSVVSSAWLYAMFSIRIGAAFGFGLNGARAYEIAPRSLTWTAFALLLMALGRLIYTNMRFLRTPRECLLQAGTLAVGLLIVSAAIDKFYFVVF